MISKNVIFEHNKRSENFWLENEFFKKFQEKKKRQKYDEQNNV